MILKGLFSKKKADEDPESDMETQYLTIPAEALGYKTGDYMCGSTSYMSGTAYMGGMLCVGFGEPEPARIFCSYCNSQIPDGKLKCDNCGAPLTLEDYK